MSDNLVKKAALVLEKTDGQSDEAAMAQHFSSPELRAVVTLTKLGTGFSDAEVELTALLNELKRLSCDANRGDTCRAEAALATQANVLDALFNSLARRSLANSNEGYLDAADRYMRLALRAQGQARATYETLAAIKNPPLVFAKQANVTTGPQQINNGVAHPPRAREKGIVPNELLEAQHGERMDARAESKASGTDPVMAALDPIHRAS